MKDRIDLEKLLKSTLEHPYKADVCFLCADPLEEGSYTEEHVFPKWLQSRFDLWDQELVLLNGTPIKYRNLKIPCCRSCNNELLSELENKIRIGFENGYDSFNKIDDFEVFLWIAKIFLGTIYKELFLFYDRKDESAGYILTNEFLKRYSILHFWLQFANRNDDKSFCPGSVFVLKSQVPINKKEQFDLIDDALNGVIYIRFGEIVVIADFLENGLHKKALEDELRKLQNIDLHPLQSKEFAIRIIYGAKLLNVQTDIKFMIFEGKLIQKLEWKAINNGELFSNWNQEEYSKYLSHYTQTPFDQVFVPPDKVRSLLYNPNGEYIHWEYGTEFPYGN